MKRILAFLLTLCLMLGMLSTMAFAADAKSDDIVILHTNDVHCGVTDGLGYAGVAAYKAEMQSTHNYVALVDCGDAIQGEPIGLLSAGSYLVDIMNEVGYDYATFGNHEFDYKMPQLAELVAMAKYKYVSCNFQYTGKDGKGLDVAPYEIATYGTTKVAYVGITTPESYVKSTPAYFKDDDGNFIYTFNEDKTGEKLYAAVQTAVDAARKDGADYVIAIAHLGMEGTTDYWTSEAVIKNTTGIDAMLDGHSHEAYSTKVANKDGKDVILAQTKTKLANLGKLTIAADGTITSELISAEDYTEKDTHISEYIKKITDSFSAGLNEVIGKSEVDLIDSDKDGNRLVRNTETNLGDLCADAFRVMMDADIGIMNGGSIRKPIKAGNITLNALLSVFPWGNLPCKVALTGQTVLDMLEMGASAYPSENGGFLHVSGLKYSIMPRIASTIEKTEKGEFVKVAGARRVCNVEVLNRQTGKYEPIDVNKTYTLGGIDYTILYCGDGFNMFSDVKLVRKADVTYTDAKMVTEYIKTKLGGKIGQEYAKPQGRISVVTYADVDSNLWYAPAIDYVTDKKLMNGSGQTFQPENSTSRAMIVTMLYRQAGSPTVEGKLSDTFTDCADGAWYSDAILWAAQNKIVTGYGDVFKPEQAVTRQEMAKILYQYALYNGAEKVTSYAVSYTDKIDSWALAGVAYCTTNKLMTGVGGGRFAPTATATRAMGAQILMNLDKAASTAEAE